MNQTAGNSNQPVLVNNQDNKQQPKMNSGRMLVLFVIIDGALGILGLILHFLELDFNNGYLNFIAEIVSIVGIIALAAFFPTIIIFLLARSSAKQSISIRSRIREKPLLFVIAGLANVILLYIFSGNLLRTVFERIDYWLIAAGVLVALYPIFMLSIHKKGQPTPKQTGESVLFVGFIIGGIIIALIDFFLLYAWASDWIIDSLIAIL